MAGQLVRPGGAPDYWMVPLSTPVVPVTFRDAQSPFPALVAPRLPRRRPLGTVHGEGAASIDGAADALAEVEDVLWVPVGLDP